MTMAYATAEDLIGWLDAPEDDELSDSRRTMRARRMDILLGAASSAVNSYCERDFYAGTVPAVKRFYPPELNGRSANRLPIGDTYEPMGAPAISVEIDTRSGLMTLAPTAYRVGRALRSSPWTVLHRLDGLAWSGEITVTATWGWSEIPDGVILATMMQAARWYQRPKSPLGVQIIGDEGDAIYVRINDPDIRTILREFKRR